MEKERRIAPYDRREVLSSLRKSVRLDDIRGAEYWVHVLLTFGGRSAQRVVARQLWIMAAEDVDEDMVVLRAHAVHKMAGAVATREDRSAHGDLPR